MYFFLGKNMLESGWVQQNIRTTAEFPSHILSGQTQACFPLATRRAHCSEIFTRENIQSYSTDWPFEVVRERLGLGRCCVKLHHGTVFGTSSSVMVSRERFWKRGCFIHWLLRGCAGKWIEIGPPRQTALAIQQAYQAQTQKRSFSLKVFSLFLVVNLSRVKAFTHTVLFFFLEAKDLFLQEKGSNKTHLFFEDILKFQK